MKWKLPLAGTIVLILGMPVMTWAQSITIQDHKVYYPGSVWTSFGRLLTPAEPRNITILSHAEQGIAFRGAEIYGVGEFWNDHKGFDWNNRSIGGAGIRFTQSFRGGMVRGGVAYLGDRRRLRDETFTHGMTLLVESYYGWGRENVTTYTIPPVGVPTTTSTGGR